MTLLTLLLIIYIQIFNESRCQTVIRGNRKTAELKPMTQMDRLSKRINNERIPLTLYRSARRLNNTGCQDGDGCLPETGDLLVGRKNFLYASSTCGLNGPVRYCAMTSKNTEDYFNQNTKGSCFVCDSTDVFNRTANRYSHRVENIVNGKSMEIDRQGREVFVKWWQSENSKHHVFIQFDLEVEFIFTHVIMIFKSFVPAAMLIEKSSDFGRTWKPHAYFAHNCRESFPRVSIERPKRPGDVYCESRYSSPTPSSRGEIIYRAIPPHLLGNQDPYSDHIFSLLKITNLRINFTRLHTFGDNLLDSREDIREKYYYALAQMVVRGSCLCYGHASACKPVEDDLGYDQEDKSRMIHGRCDCKHNTDGVNCDRCLPLYNDRPWSPAKYQMPNECRKCKCNNHAYKCRLDFGLYRSSGNVSGGVCEDCQHNTMGRHCDLCRHLFWRDPSRKLYDRDVCKPCNCHGDGSMHEKCNQYDDDLNGLKAGQCSCKPNVEGDRCDTCKNGYFNLTNDGCQKCSCDMSGTAGNKGCDKQTGYCECKLNVVGHKCNECRQNYYGLSADDQHGCRPCDCSSTGAYTAQCDRLTGQCSCKPNRVGLKCNQVQPGYYCPNFDYHLYEAEYADKLNNKSVDFRKASNLRTWTGDGFVRVFEDAQLRFRFNNIMHSDIYDLSLRYRSEVETVVAVLDVTIRRLTSETTTVVDGKCANTSQQFVMPISFQTNIYHHFIQGPFCFESNQVYEILLKFTQIYAPYASNYFRSENIKLLIDSLVLVPYLSDKFIDSESEYERNAFEYCRRLLLEYNPNINDFCKTRACEIDWIGLQKCACNPIGSYNNSCDFGQCLCKPNVYGSTCDKCVPSTWGFSASGCQSCNCHASGSKTNICNAETGECDCHENIAGQLCDKCKTGHYNFEKCSKCECNGFSTTCTDNGFCMNCTGNTMGRNCELCLDGYFALPNKSCKKCMCPGSNGNNNGKTCGYDNTTESFKCVCDDGYAGDRCERCANGYYGNPNDYNGRCRRCECNDNIDLNKPGSCDTTTGECLRCLGGTEGFYCERCKEGYYRPENQTYCLPCMCNELGTVGNSDKNCNQLTGQCKCLPNVMNLKCDACSKDYWNFGSGKGCEPCNCDEYGTIQNSTQCHDVTGFCACLDNIGGRKCDECPSGMWGHTTKTCSACDCSLLNSLSQDCDKMSGKCLCRPGLTGDHCDQCKRGTKGHVPNCQSCGECYSDWDNIIRDLDGDSANGSLGEFHAFYADLENKLNDVKTILGLKSNDHSELMSLKSYAKDYNNELSLLNSLKPIEEHLLHEALLLREASVTGATTSLHESEIQTNAAVKKMHDLRSKIDNQFDQNLKKLDEMLNSTQIEISKQNVNFESFVTDSMARISNISGKLNDLSKDVCGSQSFSCLKRCGLDDCDDCSVEQDVSSVNPLPNDYYLDMELDNCQMSIQSFYLKFTTTLTNFKNVYEQKEQDLKKLLSKDAGYLTSESNRSEINYNHVIDSIMKLQNLLTPEIKNINEHRESMRNAESFLDNVKNTEQEYLKISETIQQAKKKLEISLEEISKDELDFDKLKNKNQEIADIIINTKNEVSISQNLIEDMEVKTKAIEIIMHEQSTTLDLKDAMKLKTSIQNSDVLVASVVNKLAPLKTKSIEIESKLAESVPDGADGKHLIDVLLRLESDIIAKKEKLIEKLNKTMSLEQEYVRNGLSLDMLREKGDMLTKRVIQLKAEVAGKLEYFQGCQ